MAEFDITSKVASKLDPHLFLALLDFIEQKSIYQEKEILETKVELLKKTKLVDFHIEIYKRLHKIPESEEVPELSAQRESVLKEMTDLKERLGQSQGLSTLLASNELIEKLEREPLTQKETTDALKISKDEVDFLSEYAKFFFETGQYSDALQALRCYIALVPYAERDSRWFSANWGRLACKLLSNSPTAFEDTKRLKDLILSKRDVFESNGSVQFKLLGQRTWWLHWSIFTLFFQPDYALELLEIYFKTEFLNTIYTTSPYLVRYIIAAIIIYDEKRQFFDQAVTLLNLETIDSSDPVIKFLSSLIIEFDFDEAKRQFEICLRVLSNDFFTQREVATFESNAFLLIFETYCRIHGTADISTLANQFGITEHDVEEYIIRLIREGSLEAKVDASCGQIVTNLKNGSYQKIIEKTKEVGKRVSNLSNLLKLKA